MKNSGAGEYMLKLFQNKKSGIEAPHIYANAIYIDYNPIEFFLKFGISEPGCEAVDDYARIHLSPQHALLLSKVLAGNIEEYEKRVGKINLPKGLLEEIFEVNGKK